MKRATFLRLMGGLPFVAVSAQEADSFSADVSFLLDAFGKQAGGLLKVKKVDWPAVCGEFTRAAAEVKTDDEKYRLVSRLVARLHDGHAFISSSQIKPLDEAKGRRYTGPRVHLVSSGDEVLIRLAFKDAANAGLAAGQQVIKIDDMPAREWLSRRVQIMREKGSGFSTPHQALYAACHWGLADWEGTAITFEVKDATGAVKSVRRVRNGGPNYAPVGPIFPPENLKFVGRQSYGRTGEGPGYIHLRDIPGDLPGQLDKMLAELGNIPGLILDMRANGGGGCDHAAVFGRFLAKEKQWGAYTGMSDHGFTGPLVVIVDAGVRSAGETVAGMFKEDSRAYMIGDSPTAGMSSQKTEITTPSGLFKVRFSVSSNMSRFNKGRGIEGMGVIPHETVPVKAKDLGDKKDSLILRATELLNEGFPENTVDYTGA